VYLGAIVAHLLRVFFTGAFRKPREISWIVGVTLFVVAIAAGFTGYSLPDDLLSGTGLRIIYSAVLSIPFVGTWLAFLLFGGEFPDPALLPRLLVLHILLIPLLLLGLLSVHLALVWHQTHTQFRARGRTEDTVVGIPVWPRFALKSFGLALTTFGVLAGLGGLAQVNPVWFYGPYLPYTAASPAQPDYYAGWLEGALRISPNWEVHVLGHTVGELFLPAVVFPGVFFTILALWPFIEARVSRDRSWHHFAQKPREAPLRTGIGAAGLTFFTVLMLAGSNDVLAAFLGIEVDTLNRYLQVALFLLPVAVGIATFRICRDLRDRGARPIAHPEGSRISRNAQGGFDAVEEPPRTSEEVSEP
jgi:ubiquinol-cytochrome c reductase cytochrome b subunit